MNVLVVDDHPLFQSGFCALCASLAENITIDSCFTLAEAEQKLKRCQDYDLVFIDIQLEDGNGLDLLQSINRNRQAPKCIILSAHSNVSLIEKSFKLGAKGYLLKTEKEQTILNAIQLILDGGCYFPQTLSGQNTSLRNRLFSKKQMEILDYIAQGKSNKEIANSIFLSEGTVRNYISEIYQILGAKNRVEAVNRAKEKGIITSLDH